MTCPPNHNEYLSRAVADNAVTLHKMSNPACTAIEVFACGDHFHIGHGNAVARKKCHETETRHYD